jgi:hypothetical protein
VKPPSNNQREQENKMQRILIEEKQYTVPSDADAKAIGWVGVGIIMTLGLFVWWILR